METLQELNRAILQQECDSIRSLLVGKGFDIHSVAWESDDNCEPSIGFRVRISGQKNHKIKKRVASALWNYAYIIRFI